MNNNTELFNLIDTENSSYSLISSSFQEFETTFVKCGYEGGGYDWEAVARQTIRSLAPQLEKSINFDSEASMFCAYGEDKDALQELKKNLVDVFTSSELLKKTIQEADPNWFD